MKKICSKCKIEKLIDEFHKDRIKKAGLNAWCKECQSKYAKEYYKRNIEKITIQAKKYRKENIKKNANYMKNYMKKYYKKYPGKRAKCRKEYYRKNIKARLNNNISTLMRYSLKSNKNGKHWENLVGYTLDDLRKHLENLFQPKMTWENYGKGKDKWHIDHIIPIYWWNITSIKCKGFKKCWALDNLQPLWEKDNLSKCNKLFI